MRVLVVRHPEVAVPEGLCYGRRDVPLATGWEAWARDLARLVELLPAPALCLHSPLQRCLQPASLLGVEMRAEPRLIELDFGVWDGLDWNEVPRRELDAWAGDIASTHPGGGESVAQMYARTMDLVNELRAGGQRSYVALSHSGPIRCLLAHALGLGPASVLRLQVDLGSVSSLSLSETGDRLEFSNRRPPLLPFPGFG